jgi:hypothetical protein
MSKEWAQYAELGLLLGVGGGGGKRVGCLWGVSIMQQLHVCPYGALYALVQPFLF